ncbi:MAG TPA: hypothetical protein VF665_15170 [Longimicrobium sp.]|uniref:hypothetical protein n=1 Tax=Longimicrobium sp. TaxID=2029185 RepID=UPI002EDAEE81
MSRIKLPANWTSGSAAARRTAASACTWKAANGTCACLLCPPWFGESVVLRLLDRGGRPVALSELGMPAHVRTGMEAMAR